MKIQYKDALALRRALEDQRTLFDNTICEYEREYGEDSEFALSAKEAKRALVERTDELLSGLRRMTICAR